MDASTTPLYPDGLVPLILDGLKVLKEQEQIENIKKPESESSKKKTTESYLELTKILSYESQEDESQIFGLGVWDKHVLTQDSQENVTKDDKEKTNQTKQSAGKGYRQDYVPVRPKYRKIVERHVSDKISESSRKEKTSREDTTISSKITTVTLNAEGTRGRLLVAKKYSFIFYVLYP